MNTKICNKCGIEKPLSEFYNRSASKDKKTTYCKACITVYQRGYCKKIHEMRERADMLVAFRLQQMDTQNKILEQQSKILEMLEKKVK